MSFNNLQSNKLYLFFLYLKLLRFRHWVKNLFIFIPLFFSGEFFDTKKLLETTLVFLSFSLITGLIYIINDIFDLEFDKNHPYKKQRPIAAGKISIKNALCLGITSFVIGILVFIFTSSSFLFISIYIILNILYSYKLKHIPIVDFIIISLGFIIRILIGSEVGKIELNQWTLILVFLLSLFIAVTKRRDDVFQFEFHEIMNRKVVDKYSVEYMDKIITIVSSVLLVTYLLFITSYNVQIVYSFKYLFVSFVLVLIGVFRFNQITYVYKKSGSPIKILYNDIFLQVVIVLWLFTFFIVIYLYKLVL